MEKERVDILLVKQGLFDSREQAKRAVMAGEVLGKNNERLDKPGQKIATTTTLHLKGKKMPYVSRGGLKLAKALKSFGISVADKVVLDIGSSTGGFTDCMLQNGAKKVYAVDVGYGQLAWSLRTDERVVCMERTNVRYLDAQQISEQVDFVSIDVSFISLSLVVPPLAALLREGGQMVALVKPQFEAGREKVGKKGVVRDPAVHREVLEKVCALAQEAGLCVRGLTYSPIKGPEGNIEFLCWLQKGVPAGPQPDIAGLVQSAHAALDAAK